MAVPNTSFLSGEDMSAESKHRGKIIRAAALLFRRVGYTAAGMNDIVALSGAPKGSVYHYFPGGKEQLAQEALRYAGGLVTQTLTDLAQNSDSAAEMLGNYAVMLAHWLSASNFQDGCPVTTTLLETAGSIPSLSYLGRETFSAWQAIIAAKLVQDGLSEKRASTLASFALSSLEGALVLARVEQNVKPIEIVGMEIGAVFNINITAIQTGK
jgi:TetR/AcrR family transcriptional repressor of lmrAB and yxaGH operons